MTTNWSDDVATLIAALDEANPRRSRGGGYAIAGFEYQANLALLDFVRTARDQDQSGLAMQYETVADYAIVDQNLCYTVEVKKTLDHGSLKRGLDVLFDVYQTATSTVPNLMDRLHFKLASAMSEIQSTDSAKSNWAKAQYDPTSAEQFLGRVDLAIEPQPLGELISILATYFHVKEPRQLVDKWFRQITAQAAGRNMISEEILSDLSQKKHQELTRFLVLSDDDKEPVEILPRQNGFLVSSQPTLSHLREGFFAPAGDYVDVLAEEFWKWLRAITSDADPAARGKLPCFWIFGPSGTGKSILLLQLLARLNSFPNVSTLWLGGAVENLQEATVFAKSLGQDRTVLIGIDDPFFGGFDENSSYLRAALAEVTARRQNRQIDLLPVLVCCGPTEHFIDFRAHHSQDVEISSFLHGRPSRSFYDALRNWFVERTGDVGEPTKYNPNVLPVQLFLEWWQQGSIGDFATRFRNRIRRLGPGVDAIVGQVLALNRLYVGYPDAALNNLHPVTRDKLTILVSDMHFASGKVGRPGFWMLHPRLSALLYDLWYPETSTHHIRTAHLVQAVESAVNADNSGASHSKVLRAFVPQLQQTEGTNVERLSRVARPDIVKVIKHASALVANRRATLEAPAITTWLMLRAVAPECLPEWDPAEVALKLIDNDQTDTANLTLLLSSLLESNDIKPVRRVREFLAVNPLWEDWSELMTKLRPWFSHELDKEIADGVLVSPSDPARITLLTHVIATQTAEDADLFSVAASVLELADDDSAAEQGLLARELLSHSIGNQRAAIAWLLKKKRRENGPCLEVAVTKGSSPLVVVDIAKHWLYSYPTDSASNGVFAATVSWHRFTDSKYYHALQLHISSKDISTESPLIRRLIELMMKDLHHPSWTYVFNLFESLGYNAPAIKNAGSAWLENNRASSGWPGVWLHLAGGAESRDSSLSSICERRLPSVRLTESWPFLKRRVLDVCDPSQIDQHVEDGIEWLEINPTSATGWGYLFPSLCDWASDSQKRRLEIMVAADWLPNYMTAPHWSYVWRSATRIGMDGPNFASLVELAYEWLRSPRTGWGHVFRRLSEFQLNHEKLLELAVDWLRSEHKDDQWLGVFEVVSEVLSRHETIQLLSLWLRHAKGEDTAVGFVWARTVEAGRHVGLETEPMVLRDVLGWLNEASNATTWWHIWSTMLTRLPHSTDLIELSLTVPVNKSRSYGIANRLTKNAMQDAQVAGLIFSILGKCEHTPTWIALWHMLLTSALKDDPRLWQTTIAILNAEDCDNFTFIWQAVWDSNTDYIKQTYLEAVGYEWIRANSGPFWAPAWLRLIENANPMYQEDLLSLGVVWAADVTNNDCYKYGLVLNKLESFALKPPGDK